jgi:hypothetical protein
MVVPENLTSSLELSNLNISTFDSNPYYVDMLPWPRAHPRGHETPFVAAARASSGPHARAIKSDRASAGWTLGDATPYPFDLDLENVFRPHSASSKSYRSWNAPYSTCALTKAEGTHHSHHRAQSATATNHYQLPLRTLPPSPL